MKHRRRKTIILTIVSIGLVVTLAAVAVGGACIAPYRAARMDMTLMEISIAEPARLLAYDAENRIRRTGELHTAESCTIGGGRPRVFVPYEEMPAHLVNAFIAIEDKRFRKHCGVDVWRTARAGVNYLLGRASFGGSTITQQLVKNLTGHDEYTPHRKLNEIFCAMDLERQADKNTILETYLNIINLAEGCTGVGMAARTYFSKSVAELTLPECAVIAAITCNPSRYDPITHPENNRARRDLVLRQMAEQGYITAEELTEALATPLVLAPSELYAQAKEQPTSWYADLVASDVIHDLCVRLGYTYTAASLLVYNGGLTIETAQDEGLQAIVETYYADLRHFPVGEQGRPQSSFILIDPTTGDILAVAGAVGEKVGSRLQSYATDTRRPAGSCIKPLTVYAPALERGLITWADIYEDEPICLRGDVPWPANADGLYRGRVTVGQSVAHSLNPVAVRILSEVGVEESFSFAQNRLGLGGLIHSSAGSANDCTVSSLALGQQSRGLTCRELTAAYTAFYDGIYRPPVSYHRVLDREGRVLLENTPATEANRALTAENAALMTRLLMTVTRYGTAKRYLTITEALAVETAGKTGTTQNNCDRRFVGYTPRLLAGVWMGYDYPAELKGIQGNPCVTIWNELMTLCEEAYAGAPPKLSFDCPDSLVELDFCPLSGGALNEYCLDPVHGCAAEGGWFVRGTEPEGLCDLHGEPPIRVSPVDPADPDRIPLLPNDVLPEATDPLSPLPPPRDVIPWYSRWFRMFSRGGR